MMRLQIYIDLQDAKEYRIDNGIIYNGNLEMIEKLLWFNKIFELNDGICLSIEFTVFDVNIPK